jgi:hypothetical protein
MEWIDFFSSIDSTAILVAIITIAIAGLGKVIQFLYKRGNKIYIRITKENKIFSEKEVLLKLKKIDDDIQDIHHKESKRILINNVSVINSRQLIKDIISDIVITTKVDRFIMFTSHNGNGQPSLLKLYKISYMDYNAMNKTDISRYQNITPDNQYTKMLIDIQNNEEKRVKLVTKEMPKDSMLKFFYEKEGIVYAEVYFVHSTETGIIYISAASSNQSDFEEDKYYIRSSINKIQDIFEEEEKRVSIDKIESEINLELLKKYYIERDTLLK